MMQQQWCNTNNATAMTQQWWCQWLQLLQCHCDGNSSNNDKAMAMVMHQRWWLQGQMQNNDAEWWHWWNDVNNDNNNCGNGMATASKNVLTMMQWKEQWHGACSDMQQQWQLWWWQWWHGDSSDATGMTKMMAGNNAMVTMMVWQLQQCLCADTMAKLMMTWQLWQRGWQATTATMAMVWWLHNCMVMVQWLW